MPDNLSHVDSAALDLDGRRGPLWRWHLLLLSPFLLCLAVLLMKGVALPVFWGDDETIFHWPLSLWFAARLPHVPLVYPDSATTPLLQLLGACLVRVCGPHLVLARFLNGAICVTGVFVLFATLHRTLRHGAATAALLTAVYLASSYFFGYTFRFLTDGPALTGGVLAMSQLLRFADPAEARPQRAFLLGCLWLSVTILTRQSYLFLGLPFACALLLSGQPPRVLATGLAGLALAVIPFAGLVLAWHGLVPPFAQARHTASLVNIYPLALPLTMLGFYTPFFMGPDLLRRARTFSRAELIWPALASVAALVALWEYRVLPIEGRLDLLTYFPVWARESVGMYFAGWIYNVAAAMPAWHGNSLLFWVLLPCGGAAAAGFLRAAARPGVDPRERVAALYLLGLLLASTINSICAQKYYDAPVLLFLIWQSRGEAARDPWRRLALGTLIGLFAAYFVIYIFTHPPSALPPPNAVPQ